MRPAHEEFPNFWSENDAYAASMAGWQFAPMGTMDFNQTPNRPKNFETNVTGYGLIWVNENAIGFGVPLDKWIAECAARGDPLYSRAWLFFCYLQMQGMIVEEEVIGDTFDDNHGPIRSRKPRRAR